ncbi:type II secretion system F family protein [Candidatus Fukatsuia symbiotica]|uniref:type II secretion system F family protein n=2 Tax=Candidatus Fukatsuia symbiotica TaxID=1878942 RepID=UPI002B244330|nr:type II secretion system F family protein [Candidatus Fukatsuia symbiotica]MEA9446229.1 type II secretion system F family protein [Candidatus Fukatsuia symbiotica]
MNKFQRWLCKLTLNSDDREAIYDNFRHYLLDGQSLEKTFDKMIVNYTRRGKKPNNEIAQILTECAAHLKEGHSLGEALKDWFPEQELSVIDACNIAGRPWDGFKKAMKIATSTDRLKKAIRGAMLTSAYLFSLSFIILAMACVMLVPFLLESVPLVRWSLAQKGVYYFYIFIVSYGWLLIIGFIIFCSIIAYTMPRWVGKKRFYADQFPPYSFYKQRQGATFITSIDALLSSNIPLKNALIKMREMSQSAWLIEKINGALARLADGEENLGSALDTAGYEFPSEDAIIKMQSLFETTNQEGSLERFGDRLLEKTLLNVERQGNVIKVVSMFSGAAATVGIVGIMYSLIEIAINF